MKIWKKLLAMTLSAVMLSCAVPVSITVNAAETAPAEASEERPQRVWQTDIRMYIRNERQVMQEAGADIDAWDAKIAAVRQAALEDMFTEESLLEADPYTEILEEDGRIYYIGPSGAFKPVRDAADAYRLAYRLAGVFGGSEETCLMLWSELGIDGQKVYSFQEVAGGETVKGSTMKIALDENGEVTAVFANIVPPEDDEADGEKGTAAVSRQEAEEEALSHCESGEVFPEYTERTVFSTNDMAFALDLESDEESPRGQPAWIVYTSNSGEDKDTYPYLAHYVRMDGMWLKSLAVKEPGDEESLNGYRKQDIFADMEPGEYTGEIRSLNGETRKITVPVMRGRKDGKWYLGDLDRRIAMADFYEAAYLDDHPINLVESGSNSGWDNEDLFMYYNYIRAWDFYADMGWVGPDGQGTDVVILKGLAYRSHDPYVNAASVGRVENWQMFGYAPYEKDGTAVGLVQGLDVLAHEYTHTFTSSVMNENLYENDLGAINEAMSDIMGNLVEFICQDTTDTRWDLGENTGNVIRCMSDPKSKGQPAFVWDLYYGPHAKTPVVANDRGGVHSNSSLLNLIAADLCLEYGMSYEDAVRFWLTVAMGMTPSADYRQMPALLKWAAEVSGNEEYIPALDAMATAERLDFSGVPDTFPEGLKLVRLKFPETEAFEDDNWAMIAYQMNTDSLLNFGTQIMTTILFRRDFSSLANTVRELSEHIRLEENRLEIDKEGIKSELGQTVLELIRQNNLVTQTLSWEFDGTQEILVVTNAGQPTLYMLMNLAKGGSEMRGMLIMINGHWYDFSNMSEEDKKQFSVGVTAAIAGLVDKKDGSTLPGQTENLSSDGLEHVQLGTFQMSVK